MLFTVAPNVKKKSYSSRVPCNKITKLNALRHETEEINSAALDAARVASETDFAESLLSPVARIIEGNGENCISLLI